LITIKYGFFIVFKIGGIKTLFKNVAKDL